jgi:hypothetical protein
MRKLWTLFVILCLTRHAIAQTSTSSVFFTTPDRGGAFAETAGIGETLVSGYSRVQPSSSTTPAGVAIYGFRENGALVAEAGVEGVIPVLSGRTYAEVNGPINTGIAFANPNGAAVQISFFFTNENGTNFGQTNFPLGANAKFASFLNQPPFNLAQFAGTLTFTATAPVAVLALRGVLNARNEFLFSAQTVAPLPGDATATPVVIGHFADGGGWKTETVLFNPSDANLAGTVQFFGQENATAPAGPLTINVNGQTASSFSYIIGPRSFVKLVTSNPPGTTVRVGSIRITPTGGSRSPAGFAVLSFTILGIQQTETAVPIQMTGSRFRSYVEVSSQVAEPNATQSAIAVANTSTTSATVTFELYSLNGVYTGLTTVLSIPPNGHRSFFVHELFPTLLGLLELFPEDLPFRGLLRINAGVSPIVVTSMRTRLNERSEVKVTTLPVSNEASPSNTGALIFPHIVDAGGYTTQFILFSGVSGQSTQGNLVFLSGAGQPLNLTIR